MAGKIKIKHSIFFVGLVLLLVFLGTALFKYSQTYPVDVSPIENIDGIPFPLDQNIIITEKLAHADIYVADSSFARTLNITTTFKPLDTLSIFVGIRENSFWLSYPKLQLCCSQEQKDSSETSITVTVAIPITDKILDTNGSLDLMYFSVNPNSTANEDEGIYDRTNWILEDINVISSPTIPTRNAIKDYIKSKLTPETPL